MANKKAGEKYLSIWWFFVLIVIFAAVAAGVIMNNFINADIKETDANFLAEKIVLCMVDNSYVNEKVFLNDFDVFKECNLNENIIRKSYFFKIEAFSFEKCQAKEFKIDCKDNLLTGSNYQIGDSGFLTQCKIKKLSYAKNYPSCSEKYHYALRKDSNKKIILHVIAGSNNQGRQGGNLK